MCANQAGGGEACFDRGYHTARGFERQTRVASLERRPFAAFVSLLGPSSRCPHLSRHPLADTAYAAPVVGASFAPRVATPPRDVCSSGRGPDGCRCGFRRLRGVDNAAAARRKPFYGYGVARVVWAAGEEPSLAACEARCCDEPTCHSVTYDRNSSACTAGLAIAHGE